MQGTMKSEWSRWRNRCTWTTCWLRFRIRLTRRWKPIGCTSKPCRYKRWRKNKEERGCSSRRRGSSGNLNSRNSRHSLKKNTPDSSLTCLRMMTILRKLKRIWCKLGFNLSSYPQFNHQTLYLTSNLKLSLDSLGLQRTIRKVEKEMIANLLKMVGAIKVYTLAILRVK